MSVVEEVSEESKESVRNENLDVDLKSVKLTVGFNVLIANDE